MRRLSPRIRSLIADMRLEWAALDRRIAAFDALAAAVGNAATFARGRDLAAGSAWSRQMTTGGRPRLLGISKRGNKYLRKLLVHGARAALPSLSASSTPLGRWLRSLMERAHKNTVVVALGNKLVRIVWTILRHGGTYNAHALKLV
jgi:transposase